MNRSQLVGIPLCLQASFTRVPISKQYMYTYRHCLSTSRRCLFFLPIFQSRQMWLKTNHMIFLYSLRHIFWHKCVLGGGCLLRLISIKVIGSCRKSAQNHSFFYLDDGLMMSQHPCPSHPFLYGCILTRFALNQLVVRCCDGSGVLFHKRLILKKM